MEGSNAYASIWGPTVNQDIDHTTVGVGLMRSGNLLQTIRPYKPELHHVAEVMQITIGKNEAHNIHINYRGEHRIYSYKEAKELFPKKLGHYILKNDMVLLKGFEWATR